VGTNLDGPGHAGLEYEVSELLVGFSAWNVIILGQLGGLELVQESLDYVVAVAVSAHHERMALELFHDRQKLVVQRTVFPMPVVGDSLNQDLNGSGAVLVQRNVK